MITEDGIKKHLENSLKVLVYDELVSTNTTAKELFEGGADGELLILARRQSGGRGRLGRSFFSPDGGLYMSLLLRPDIDMSEAVRITTAASVAVCRALEANSNICCSIKWVNDVYANGKKICGILTESRIGDGGKVGMAVLGIGVNLLPPEEGYPDNIKGRAGAVFGRGDVFDADRICADIINRFLRLYRAGLNPADFIDEYRSRSLLIGKNIDVMRIHNGEAVPAVAVGIAEDFGLSVRYGDGSCEVLTAGDVSIRI